MNSNNWGQIFFHYTQSGSFWQIPVSDLQTLNIYDLLGNEVVTLVNEYRSDGSYEVEFNGSNLSSGVYNYQLRADEFVQSKKMVLIK